MVVENENENHKRDTPYALFVSSFVTGLLDSRFPASCDSRRQRGRMSWRNTVRWSVEEGSNQTGNQRDVGMCAALR